MKTAEYKCRRCGVIIHSTSTSDEFAISACKGGKVFKDMSLVPHYCHDHGIGVAELIGFHETCKGPYG